MVLNDEHRSQILSNILQVKERGATTVIFTNLPDITKFIDACKMDFVIQLPPVNDMELFSAL